MTIQQKIETQFQFLIQSIDGADETFYDESDDSVHTYENGTLEISTDFADSTSYMLSKSADGVTIELQRLDNYKLHDKAKVITAPMTDEDYEDLSERLERIVQQIQSADRLKKVDLKPVWDDVMTAFFTSPSLGEKPKKAPALKKDPSYLAEEIQKILQRAKRTCEWEWKEWPELGVSAVNQLRPLRELDIEIPKPTLSEIKAVNGNEDFTGAVLDWFDQALSPQGFSLMALTSLDELQNFSLVCTSSLRELQPLLKLMGIHCQLAPRYQLR